MSCAYYIMHVRSMQAAWLKCWGIRNSYLDGFNTQSFQHVMDGLLRSLYHSSLLIQHEEVHCWATLTQTIYSGWSSGQVGLGASTNLSFQPGKLHNYTEGESCSYIYKACINTELPITSQRCENHALSIAGSISCCSYVRHCYVKFKN